MSGAISELCREFGAVLLTGVVVKTMDDYLDEACVPPELACPSPLSDRAVLPYCLAVFGLATWLGVTTSFSLFLASYCLGMVYDMRDKTPSGLRGYQESLLAVAAGVFLMGWREMLGGLCAIGAIQCFDDVLDYPKDLAATVRSVAVSLGRVEALAMGIGSFTVGLIVDQRKTCLVLVAAILIWTASACHRRRRRSDAG